MTLLFVFRTENSKEEGPHFKAAGTVFVFINRATHDIDSGVERCMTSSLDACAVCESAL